MAVLYVKEQGAMIQKRGERVIVRKNQQVLLDKPLIQIDNLAIIGNVQISTQALHMFMEKGVDVSYFTYSGRYLGHTAAEASKNIFLRLEQYRFYMDDKRRLAMAKCIIRNKILNQIALIRNYRFEHYDSKPDICSMEKLLETVSEKETTNELLGVEGMCSNIYFGAFAHMIKGDFRFEGRNRRPPKDPVNIILSLAYTFLTKEVSNALDAESFEPYLGFLHGIRYGRKSLALDLVEKFRQPIVDRLVILLFNKGTLGKYDFMPDEDGRMVLSENAFKKFCSEYERWMNSSNTASADPSFRTRIRNQILLLRGAISGREEYKPYEWR